MQALLAITNERIARGIFRSANRANKILSGVAKPSTATNNTKISKTQTKIEQPKKTDIESLSRAEQIELLKQMYAQIAELEEEIYIKTAKKTQKNPIESKPCPFISGLMHYPAKDPKYSLPIPAGEIHITYEMQQGVFRSGFPPFIARQDSLLALLTNAYNSHYGPKPIVTLITTSSGFGKSRTLIEWAVQVFQKPAVVHAFLRRQEIDVTVQQDIAEQIMEAWKSDDGEKKRRAIFLVRLHRTIRESTVISVHKNKTEFRLREGQSCNTVTDAQVDEACKAIIKYALHSRFKGKATKEVPFDTIGEELTSVSLDKLMNLYFKLVEESLPPYSENNPIVTDSDLLYEVMKERRSLFINIDELQELFSIKNVRAKDGNETKNFVHEIARKFVFCRPFIVLNLAGLRTGPIEEIDDESGAIFYLAPSIPLDPLFKMEHLNEVCKAMFDRSLYNASDSTSLPKNLSLQLYRMWIATCGVARRNEYFAISLSRQKEIINKLKRRSCDVLSQKAEDQIYGNILQGGASNFALFQEYLGVNDLEFGKLVIDALFGITKAPSDNFGSMTYDNLEGSSALIPQKFIPSGHIGVSARRTYTLCLFWFLEDIDNELPVLRNDLSNLVNPHKIKFYEVKHSISHAINAFGGNMRPTKTTDNKENTKQKSAELVYTRQILETSTAVHTWFRYLQATNMELGKLVPCSSVLPRSINVKDFGVIALHNSVGFKKDGFNECIEFLFTNKLMAINKSESSFADIIIPLYDAEGQPKSVLCIQCRDVMPGHSKVKASYVYNETNKILSASGKFIYVHLSPNVSKADITYRSKKANEFKAWEENGKFFVSNGDGWLSEWFLRIFREKCQLNE